MSENILISIILLSPLSFFILSICSYFTQSISIRLIKKSTNLAALFYFLISIYAALLVFKKGLLQTELIGFYNVGFSFRLDTIAVCMFVMVAFLSYVIIKFSNNYLDGDQRQGLFFGRLVATIAAVQLLILSGNMGILFISWVLTSICLNRLLLYYPDRILAKIAANKKFIVARLADVALIVAFILLYATFNTGNLEDLFIKIQSISHSHLVPFNVQLAACFLAIAALFKSAQFPTHGWLIEIMETPTPVSALLHAGLLNAGPFLIIRMAFVFETSQIAGTVLIIMGGITALFASSVYLTQTSVKTALAYSSIAHMGFSLFLCGIGFYSAAMLHMVAHSFYKAHAFLSSGDLFEKELNPNPSSMVNKRKLSEVLLAFFVCVTLIVLIAYGIKINFETSDATLILTSIVLLGLSRLLLEAFLFKHSSKVVMLLLLASGLTWLAFSYGEYLAHFTFSAALPTESTLSSTQVYASILIIILFTIALCLQTIVPLLKNSEKAFHFYVHLKNGFYTNNYFDKFVGALNTVKK